MSLRARLIVSFVGSLAAQQMKESLERQDSALLFALLDRQPRAQEQLREHRAQCLSLPPAVAAARRRRAPARQPGQVAIAVTDTGTGIPPEYLRRIFEPFTQVPGVPPGGAGLGLAISRRIIEAHGGQMTVHSTPGEGSAFTFTLPTVV